MKRLVPATMVNKRALAAAVDAMEARNTSDWSKGLEFAYQAFIDVSGCAARQWRWGGGGEGRRGTSTRIISGGFVRVTAP